MSHYYKIVSIPGVSTEDFLAKARDEKTFISVFQDIKLGLEQNSPETHALLSALITKQKEMGTASFFESYNFKFEKKYDLDLIIFKSTFAPEDWSNVLKTGIETYNEIQPLHGQTVCEVGCGTGILSLYMAQKGAHVIGLDLNPDAVLCSQINALRNHLPNTEFKESNLLENLDMSKSPTVFIACIPQIYSEDLPQEDFAGKEKRSHVTPAVGNGWDKYGLGLNAKLLEDTRTRYPKATLILNLAGRLGEPLLSQLFAEKNYKTKQPLSTAIFKQASTGINSPTDISAFVKLEEKEQITCEFHTTSDSRSAKITATEAQALIAQEKPVFHSVSAYPLEPLA
ncbi:MAG: methyltransferase domain-containing protein [Candidatus Margulisbacteria bacterium]|nr:methyltransferase domain-containing protein [Candidatus Margulisiibacteriota bacterium]